MRFLFVDRIKEMNERSIVGEKSFAEDDSMQYPGKDGSMEIAPGVISEAIGQLVSWLCIKRNNFSGRPVFLFSDTIKVHAPVKPGSTVTLTGNIDEIDDETFVFSGTAHVGDQLVHSISKCSGYFMPLGDLEDPEVTRERFDHLVGEGLVLEDDKKKYDFNTLVDEVVQVDPGKSITTRKQMKLDEPFYRDHFPRYPVTPIVMINEMIRNATVRLMESEGCQAIMPLEVSNVKIKSFVRPGDTCEVNVKILGKEKQGDNDVTNCMAEIVKDGKKILRGKYSYVAYH